MEYTAHDGDLSHVLQSISTSDAKGNEVVAPDVADAPLPLLEHDVATAETLRTPSGLADGYYRTIVRYAGYNRSRSAAGHVNISYVVRDGEVEMLDPELWEEVSGHNEGRTVGDITPDQQPPSEEETSAGEATQPDSGAEGE